MLTDTHLHLQDPRLARNIERILRESRVCGLKRFWVCATSPADWPRVAALAEEYPAEVRPFFGVHPWFIEGTEHNYISLLEEYLLRFPQAGVGEIGLDGARETPPADKQTDFLARQLHLARKMRRAFSLHTVRALPRTIAVIRSVFKHPYPFIAHDCRCAAQQVAEIEKLGGYVACGVSLLDPRMKKAREAAAAASPERLLVETDAPERKPPGGRACPGEPDSHHPAGILDVVDRLAKLRGWSFAFTAQLTAANADRVFDAL